MRKTEQLFIKRGPNYEKNLSNNKNRDLYAGL